MQATPRSPLLEVNDEAREEARRIVREARHAVLGCLEPVSGDPLTSRVAVAPDITGDPVILVSWLSAHTGALLADARASLLFGTAGAGDPLAHPRVSLRGLAERIGPDHPDHERVRRRFLVRMPQAERYVDFPDFLFIRIEAAQALLNGGFAQAYRLERPDLCDEVCADIVAAEESVRNHMNANHADAIDMLVSRQHNAPTLGWRIGTIDPHGFEAIRGDEVVRIVFKKPVSSRAGFRNVFAELVSLPDHL